MGALESNAVSVLRIVPTGLLQNMTQQSIDQHSKCHIILFLLSEGIELSRTVSC